MKTDKDYIKDIFSSKLQGFEADLPPLLWNKIEANLPVLPLVTTPGKRPIYKILSWSAAAAAIILAVLYFVPQSNKNTSVAQLVENNSTRKSHSLAQLKFEDQKDDVAEKPIKAQPTLSLQASSPTGGKFIAKTKNALPVETLPNNTLPERDVVTANTTEKNTGNDTRNVYVADANKQEDFQPKDPDFERELKAKIAAFEAAGEKSKDMLADNSTPEKSEKKNSGSKGLGLGFGGGSGLSKANDVTNTLRYASAELNSAITYTAKNPQFKLEHNQPVSFGVAVNKRITNRISIESGLVYTYVSAKVKLAGDSEYKQNNRQYFNYFGIPLSVNYKFAEWEKAEFYTSLGGMIQKDFYGRMVTESSIDDLLNTDRSSQRNISQSNPQFSTTALLGIAYPLYNKLSLYTTFGGAYYFDAHNEYETIYSDRKWLFNFNLGLKFGF